MNAILRIVIGIIAFISVIFNIIKVNKGAFVNSISKKMKIIIILLIMIVIIIVVSYAISCFNELDKRATEEPTYYHSPFLGLDTIILLMKMPFYFCYGCYVALVIPSIIMNLKRIKIPNGLWILILFGSIIDICNILVLLIN